MKERYPADSKLEHTTISLLSRPKIVVTSPVECEYHMRLEEGHRLGMFIKHTN